MCIICVSPAGVQQPTETQIRTMFSTNPHGAGFMLARGGSVTIHKGFQHLEDLLRTLRRMNLTEADAVVYHFRISTQAGVCPEMTHPFPLTRRLPAMKALDLTCGIGVAHNGVIDMTRDPLETEYSDTALYIAEYLHRLVRTPSDLRDPAVLDLIQATTHSKLALMDGTGYIATVGPFIRDNGLLFSNGSYRSFYLPGRKFSLKEAQ